MRERRRGVHWGVAVSVAVLASLAVEAGAAAPTAPRITGRSAVIIDATTGTIIWQRDADRQLPPASTTKIMTTLLALESGHLDRSFTVSQLAASQVPSKLGLRPGQTVRLGDLTYALMLKSANDAAVVVAEGLAGSVEQFAALMNRRAREVGATNTHFHNPNGLPDPEHVTTTHDMAMILRHALTVPGFREIAGTSSKVIRVEDSKVHPITVRSRNRLLEGYFVPVLGKTGYTRAAGRCFAGAAELNGHKIITVVFGATDMWGDTRRLMEYGFSSYEDTAPLVQTALRQHRAKAPRAVASKRHHHRHSTVVAKRSRRSAPKAEQEVVASASPTQALGRGKSVAQTAAQTRSASAAIKGSASRGGSAGKAGDQHARLETGTTRTRR
jgi:D-alanyl-D-alanine carboxypeptidase